MQLRQNVDYGYLQGTFPSKTKRFENLGALSLSPRYFWLKTPSEHTQRGFFLFWAQKKCTKNAPNPYSDPIGGPISVIPLTGNKRPRERSQLYISI
jgi:hypothetical protein